MLPSHVSWEKGTTGNVRNHNQTLPCHHPFLSPVLLIERKLNLQGKEHEQLSFLGEENKKKEKALPRARAGVLGSPRTMGKRGREATVKAMHHLFIETAKMKADLERQRMMPFLLYFPTEVSDTQ